MGLKELGRRRSGNRLFRRAFTLLCWEGAFAFAYETWIGSSFIGGLAGELGIGIGLLTLMTALPWIGSVGQLLGLGLLRRSRDSRAYTLVLTAAARAMWLIPVGLALYWGARVKWHGEAFPVHRWFVCLALSASVTSLLASSSSTAWMTWMKRIIPDHIQGRFFGIRQRYIMVALMVANLIAASWVDWRPGGYYVGYAMLGILAIVSAGMSTGLLAFVPSRISAQTAPVIGHRPKHAAVRPARDFWKSCMAPLRDPKFRPILIFGSAFNGALLISGPYFSYYFTSELKVPMSTIAVWGIITNLGCFLSAPVWGRKIDRSGAHRSVWIAGIMMASSPLWYCVRSVAWVRAIAPFEFFTNGLAAVGYTVAGNALLFQAAPHEDNAAYFSVYTAASGLVGALAAFLGGRLAVWLGPYGGFRALWLVSSGVRFGVLGFLWWPVMKLEKRGAVKAKTRPLPHRS